MRFGLQQREYFIIILCNNARLVNWGFYGVFLKIWSEPSVLEVNIIWCTALLDVLHEICPIWTFYAFPHEWKCVKVIIEHHIKLR